MADPDVVPAHEKYGLPLSFTRDGDALVSGGWDGDVRVWAVDDWTERASIDAHEQSVNCGAITAGGVLATGSTDSTVRLWELGDADDPGPGTAGTDPIAVLDEHGGTVAGLAAHPDEELVASASYDATVALRELGGAGERTVLEGHGGNVTSVAFSGDGIALASGGLGDEAIVWSVADGAPVARLAGHGAAVVGIAAGVPSGANDGDSPDGDAGGGTGGLWTVGYNGTVVRWSDADWTERESFSLPADATPSGFAVAPASGDLAVTRDGGVLVYDADGALVAEHDAGVKGISSPRWSPDGRWLAVGGSDGAVRLYDERTE